MAISGIGLGIFVYGKKQQRWPQLVAGVLFMVYPSFVATLTQMIGIACVLAGGLWWAIRMGW